MTPITGASPELGRSKETSSIFKDQSRVGASAGDPLQALQVEKSFGNFLSPGQSFPDPLMLLRRGEPEMALGKRIVFQTGNRPHHRNPAGAFDRLPQNGFLAAAGHAVQNHAPKIDSRVQLLASKSHGGRGPGHLVAIQDQDHRGLEKLGQFRRAVASRGVNAVIQPAVSLDEGNLAFQGISKKRKPDLFPVLQKRVQIAARTPCRQGKPGGIDVIGPFFEGNDLAALFPPSCRHSEGERRLPRSPPEGGHNQPG